MDTLPELLESGTTAHPLLVRISLAKIINSVSGGAVIAPWEVDELDETWVDAFRFLAVDVPNGASSRKRIQAVKDKWLASHPTYGK